MFAAEVPPILTLLGPDGRLINRDARGAVEAGRPFPWARPATRRPCRLASVRRAPCPPREASTPKPRAPPLRSRARSSRCP